MQVKILRLSKENLKQCVPIFIREYAKKPYKEKWNQKNACAYLKEIFEGNENFAFAAKGDSRIVGFVLGHAYQWWDGKRMFVDEIVVDERFKGKGIGSKLWAAFEMSLKKHKIRQVSGMAAPQAKAMKFHKKMGLKKSDFVILEKKL